MENQSLQVLLIEDETSLREPLAERLRGQFGYEVQVAADAASAWRAVCEAIQPFDVALIDDLLVPEPDAEPVPLGVELMQQIKRSNPETECILFTGWGMGRALEALEAGAYRYLEKPVRLEELGIAIRLAAEHARVRQERDLLSTALEISKALLGELDVQKTMELIAEAVSRLVGAEASAVAYVEPETGSVHYGPMIPVGNPSTRWQRHLRETELTKRIVETGEIVYIPNTDEGEDQVDEGLREAGVKSFIALPIPDEAKPLGVLYAYSTQPGSFGVRERRVLLLIASQAAIALENARLFAETQRSARRMQALYETTRALSSSLDEERVIRDILKAVYRALQCEHVLISTVDEQARTIGIRHGIWHGQFDVFPEWMRMSRYSLDDPDILTDIYRTGRTETIGQWDDRFNRAIWDRFGHKRFLRIFMPIRMRDRVIGIVEVGYDRQEKGHIDKDEVQVLTSFMEQAAVALENARLFEEAKRRARNLETLQDLALTINSSLDLDEALERACRAAVEFLGAEHSGLVLFEADGTRGIVRAEYPALGALNKVIPLHGVPVEERLVETREPLVISNVATDESLGVVQGILQELDIQSILFVPVASKNGALLGSFSLDAVGHLRTFTDEEVELCQVFAAHVAVAIENARLFSDLAEAQEWREALIDSAIDAMIAINQEKHVTEFNRRAEEIFGWTADEMCGQDVTHLYNDVSLEQEIFEALNRGETVTERYVELKHRDGTPIPALLSATLIRDGQGHPIGQAGFVRDLRQVTLLEERLRALIHVSKTITGTLNQEQVLEQIVRLVLEAFPKARNGAIHLYKECTNRLHLLASTNRTSFRIAEYKSFDIGEGIAGWVYEHCQPVIVDNAQEDPRYKQARHPEALVHKSLVCAPLRASGQVIGTLTLANEEQLGAFKADDLDLVSTFADQAAIAIYNARLYHKAEKARQYIRSLYEASNTLISPHDPEQVLQDIVEQARVAAGATWVSVILVDETSRAQSLVVAGTNKQFDIKNLIRPNGLTMRAIRSGDAQVVENAAKERARVNPSMFQNDVAAALCLPLSRQGVRIGVMWIHYDKPRSFSEGEIDALRLYVNQASIAFDNARRMQELEQMRQAARAMSQVLELSHALQQIVESAAQVLHAECAAIWSYDEVRERFIPEELVATRIRWTELEEFRKREPRPGGTAETIMREGYVAVADISDPGITFLGDSTRGLLNRVKVKSFQGISLQVGEEKLGVLYVNYNCPRAFSEDDEMRLRSFASHASLALKNARLMAQMQRTREAAGLIAGITVQEDLGQTLRVIAQHTQRVLHSDAVIVYSYDEATEQFGEWAAEVPNPYSDGTACPPEQLVPGCAVDIILKLGGPKYYHVADDHLSQDRLLTGVFATAECIKAAIGVQLRVRDCRVGVMFVNFRSLHRFTSDELATIQLFADQAAVAIRNTQLYQVEQQHGQALGAVQETSAAVSAVLDLDRLLPMITERAAGIFGAPATSLMLWNESDQAFSIQAAFGLSEEYRREQQIDRGKVDELVGQWGLRPQVFEIGRQPIGNPKLVGQERLCNVLVAPLTIGPNLIGILNIYSKDKPRRFDNREKELAEVLANHAAIAIHNARLYQETVERSTALEALYEAGKAVTSSLALDKILKQIAAQAYKLTDLYNRSAHFSLISLVEGHKLRFAETCPPKHLARLLGQVGDMDLEKEEHIGIMGRAVKRQRSQLVSDVTKDPDYVAYDPRIRSELAVPIHIEDQVIGVINVEHTEPNAFGKGEQDTLESLAMQAATVIRHARRTELQQAVYEASKTIATRIDIEQRDLLACILEQAVTRIRWPHRPKAALGIIQLYDQDTGALYLESVYPPEEFPALATRLGEQRFLDRERNAGERIGVSGRTVLAGRVQRVADVRKDLDYLEFYPEGRSELDAPLRIGDQVVGVISLESDRLAAFDEIDEMALQALADLAAISIQTARLYQARQQRVSELEGLNRIAQSIRLLTSPYEAYRQVNESIAQLVGARLCAVLLYNEEEQALICQLPIYGVPDTIGRRYRISVGLDSPVGNAWKMLDHLILNDVKDNPLIKALGLNELAQEAGLHDTLLVKLTTGNRDIGVIQASNKSDGTPFAEDDARLLAILAAQAAAVIENARLYEELQQSVDRLRQIKGFVGSKTAIDWIRMVSTAWGHSIKREVGTSLVCAELVRQAIHGEKYQEALRELSDLDHKVREIKDIPITAPLSAEDAVSSVRVNRLIEGYLRNLWRHSQYDPIHLCLELEQDLDRTATVRASEEWIRRGLEIVVDNSVQAMLTHNAPHKQLTVQTRLRDATIEILVQDTGPGIPEGIREKLFKEPIEKPQGSRGAGVGLLLARTIFETYRGAIDVWETGPSGTQIAIVLPVEDNSPEAVSTP